MQTDNDSMSVIFSLYVLCLFIVFFVCLRMFLSIFDPSVPHCGCCVVILSLCVVLFPLVLSVSPLCALLSY